MMTQQGTLIDVLQLMMIVAHDGGGGDEEEAGVETKLT